MKNIKDELDRIKTNKALFTYLKRASEKDRIELIKYKPTIFKILSIIKELEARSAI